MEEPAEEEASKKATPVTDSALSKHVDQDQAPPLYSGIFVVYIHTCPVVSLHGTHLMSFDVTAETLTLECAFVHISSIDPCACGFYIMIDCEL